MLAHEDKFYHQNPKTVGENLLVLPLPLASPNPLPGKSRPLVSGKDVAVYWYVFDTILFFEMLNQGYGNPNGQVA